MIIYGSLVNLGTNTSVINLKATDNANPQNSVILQSIHIAPTSGSQPFKLEFFLTNYTKSVFYYSSDFYSQITGMLVSNNPGFTLNSETDISLTLEVDVTGIAANTVVDTYRIVPRLIL